MEPDRDDMPFRSRGPVAQTVAQGWIIYVFLVLLVVIPLEEILRKKPWKDKPRKPPAVAPEVARDAATCETGDVPACKRAARAYRIGRGAPLDENREAWFLDKACALGDRPSCPGGF
jgi:hypothetical protein